MNKCSYFVVSLEGNDLKAGWPLVGETSQYRSFCVLLHPRLPHTVLLKYFEHRFCGNECFCSLKAVTFLFHKDVKYWS